MKVMDKSDKSTNNWHIFSSLLSPILVEYKMQSHQLAIILHRRHMRRRKSSASIYFYLNRSPEIAQAPIRLAMKRPPTFMRRFWSSWYRPGRTITWSEVSGEVTARSASTLTFHCPSRCCKSIYRITRITVHVIITCCRPRTTCWSSTTSRTNAFAKRPTRSTCRCRAIGNQTYSSVKQLQKLCQHQF